MLLDDEALLPLTQPLSALGGTETLQALSLFDTEQTAAAVTRLIRARAERPLAPYQIAGTRDGSQNLTITWVRRTRLGGELLDGTGTVPLGEAGEPVGYWLHRVHPGASWVLPGGATWLSSPAGGGFRRNPTRHHARRRADQRGRGARHHRKGNPMSGTTNLGVTYLVATQNQKEVPINAGFDALDRALTETFDANLASANVVLTDAQYRQALSIRATSATVAGRTVTLPQRRRVSLLRNDAANTQAVGFARGTTTVTLQVGEAAWVVTDGTANGLAVLMRDFGRVLLSGSAVYDPPSIAAASGVTTTVTVVGAVLGDIVTGVSFSVDLQGLSVSGAVSAADNVSVLFFNGTAAAIDLASGTLRVRVEKA